MREDCGMIGKQPSRNQLYFSSFKSYFWLTWPTLLVSGLYASSSFCGEYFTFQSVVRLAEVLVGGEGRWASSSAVHKLNIHCMDIFP